MLSTQIFRADSEGVAPSFTVETPDKKHVLVMGWPDERDGSYRPSGMYPNDGSTAPLWTVDWHAFVSVPNGGEYLVRYGKWPDYTARYDEEAITFFARGQLLRTYKTRDLVDFPWLLSHSVSHYTWGTAWCLSETGDGIRTNYGGGTYKNNSVTFDDTNQSAIVRTQLGDELTFDLKTGDLIRSRHPATMATVALFIGLLIVYFVWRFITSTSFPRHSVIRISNVITGLLFALGLMLGPIVLVEFFRLSEGCGHEFEPFGYRVSVAFLTLPFYIAGWFGYTASLLSYDFPPGVYAFWISCVIVAALFDRVVVAILGRRRSEDKLLS